MILLNVNSIGIRFITSACYFSEFEKDTVAQIFFTSLWLGKLAIELRVLLAVTSHYKTPQSYTVECYELQCFWYETTKGYFWYLLVMQKKQKKKKEEEEKYIKHQNALITACK